MTKRSILVICIFFLVNSAHAMEQSEMEPASKHRALELQHKQLLGMQNKLLQALQQQVKEYEELKATSSKMEQNVLAKDQELATLRTELQSNAATQEARLKKQLDEFHLLRANFDKISLEREAFIKHNITIFQLPTENEDNWKKLEGTGWYELKKELKQEYFSTEYDSANGCSVERVLCFVPDKVNGKKMVIPVVHGTYSTSATYSQDRKPVFNSLKNYAEKKGNQEKAAVVLLAFNWTGKNDSVDRRDAGDSFVRLINRFFAFGDWYIHCIAHSHGGAVVIWASHHFYRPIEQVTLLATPIREHEDKRMVPNNIRRFVQFWSDADSIQGLGSLNYESLWTLLCSPFVEGSARKFNKEYAVEQMRNIRVLIDGYGPGHTETKNVIWHLFEIEKKLSSTYTYSADLQLNLVINEHEKTPKKFLLGLRENRLGALTGARDAQMRVIIEKMPPKYREQIVEQKQKNPCDAAIDIGLELDQKTELNEDDVAMKSLMEQLGRIDEDNKKIFNKLFYALKSSMQAKDEFQRVYGWDMDEKPNRLWSAVKGLYAKQGAPSEDWKKNGEFVNEIDLIGVDLFNSTIQGSDKE